MPALPASRRLSSAARWPVGIGLTSWRYLWRTTPMHRTEEPGSARDDAPPALPPGADTAEVQWPDAGAGPLFHRRYRTRIRDARMGAADLLGCVADDLDRVAPSEFASFHKATGGDGPMCVGDEYVVRMPGPWDGPVRVVERTATAFRLVTLDGHLEAGQIRFSAGPQDGLLGFAIESWARSGDWLSNLLYTRLRMAKEIQLHMWMSVLERVVELSGGRMTGGVEIRTRRVDDPGDG